MLNICYNAVDRHIENGQGDKIAIIYDSPVTDTKATITYKEVLEQVISYTFCICCLEMLSKLLKTHSYSSNFNSLNSLTCVTLLFF